MTLRPLPRAKIARKKVLIACACSGIMGQAFRELGHEAWECDLKPAEQPHLAQWHIQGDALGQLHHDWDLVIAHPVCTYLANSGVQWLARHPGRWEAMYAAAEFFNAFWATSSYKGPLCIENLIPHGYARELIGEYTQTIQPYQFGEPVSKATCLWLRDLPKLRPTDFVAREFVDQSIWLEPPGPNRQANRSRSFPGICAAMAQQWGGDAR